MNRMNRILGSAAFFVALGTAAGNLARAQEQKKDAAPKETPPAATAPAPDAASAKQAADTYKAKLEEWKGILKELRTLRQKFDKAEAGEVETIRGEWNALIARGEALIPQLRAAGMKAYAESPKEDRELERFLIKILNDDIAADHYEPAAELSQALLAGGCETKEVHDAAGVAAFCVNDFENAEKYLKQAQQDGVLSKAGQDFLPLIPTYQEYWAQEQEIRKQESAKDDLPRVKISTNKGDIVVELYENEAPGTVGNFISLIEKGFYDGLTFHRVLAGFMAQGGCPKGDGTGGPGYTIYDECKQDNYRKHFRGVLSMAKSVAPDTGGSQFFITFVPTSHLNGRHTAFGRVIEGIEVLSKIQRIDPEAKEKPEPDKIVKVEVLRKRDHEYKPNKVQ